MMSNEGIVDVHNRMVGAKVYNDELQVLLTTYEAEAAEAKLGMENNNHWMVCYMENYCKNYRKLRDVQAKISNLKQKMNIKEDEDDEDGE
jgi:hypothetical protein